MDDFEERSFPVCSGNDDYDYCDGDDDCYTSRYCRCAAAQRFCRTNNNPCEEDWEEEEEEREEANDSPKCNEDVCFLPLETGECRMDIPRYGFDPDTGKCEYFTYGGCDGNENRFASMTACEKRCQGCVEDSW